MSRHPLGLQPLSTDDGETACDLARARHHGRPSVAHSYAKNGAIAQLVERLVRNEKVSGSTPLSSTTLFSVTTEKRQVLVFPVVLNTFEFGQSEAATGALSVCRVRKMEVDHLGVDTFVLDLQ